MLLKALEREPGSSLAQLCRALDVPVSLMRPAMAELVASGTVSRVGEYNYTKYFPVILAQVDSPEHAKRDGIGAPSNQAPTQTVR